MDVEYIDVVRAQLMERRLHRDMKSLHIISGVVSPLRDALIRILVGRSVLSQSACHQCAPRRRRASACTYLGGDDDLVSDLALLHPLADELFGGLVLVIVRSVDEVPARGVVRVEQLEARLLVHGTGADRVPLVADASGT